MRFVEPATPSLKDKSPVGPQWLHEVKFDGWRVQIHRRRETSHLFSRRGIDLKQRFKLLADASLYLPECVIDGELVACDTDDRPDFDAISAKNLNLCIWCFDLLSLKDDDLREKPLEVRRAILRDLLISVDDHVLRFSEEFPDPVQLLAAAEKQGLEGVISKRRDQPYKSGKRADWVKVKAATWREANKDRWEKFVPALERGVKEHV
jgi:bifunctional non-homologous end joining protein LigD